MIGAVALLAACTNPPYELTCDERTSDTGCRGVAAAAVAAIREHGADLGEVRTVEIEVADCDRVGRAMFVPEVDDAAVRCWGVRTVWQRGQPSAVVAEFANGEIRVYR